MLKKILLFIILLALNSTCYSTTFKQVHINELKWPPFFFPALENGQVGFGREVINLCLAQIKYEPNYRLLPLKRISRYMESGEIDITTFSYKETREDFLYYAKEPLFVTEYGFASKKGDDVEINTVDDIKNYTLGDLAGLGHTPKISKILKDKRAKNEVSVGYDIDSMYGQLLAKPQRFQIMINSKETLIWRAKQLNVLDQIKVHDIIAKEKPYFITVSKNSKNIKNPREFLNKMDACIVGIKNNGTYQKLAMPYQLNYK
jgi:polar amino acid transport system substrate-binding protein